MANALLMCATTSDSTVIINCAFEDIAQPCFEVDIANTLFTDLEFDNLHQRREILRNHGLFVISDSPSAVIEINTKLMRTTALRGTHT